MAVAYPEQLEELMLQLRQLPSVGRKAAERMALALMNWDKEELRSLGRRIAALPENVGSCPECGALAESGQLCPVCADSRRDDTTLCVVETMTQLLAIESGGHYRGRYLVLGGRLSPLDGEDGSGLKLELLSSQLQKGKITEVILALSSDVEGRATAAYLAEQLEQFHVKISRPASGLPAGANLSYADGATIAAAFDGRITLK